MNSLPYALLPVDSIMNHVEARASNRETIELESASELGLHYREASRENPRGGFWGRVPVIMADGNQKMCDLPLSDVAVKTGAKLIESTPKFFAQGNDPDFFPKTFNHIMDSSQRKVHGMLVRHNKLEINSILPSNYVIKDAVDLLREFVPALQENVGQIIGILGVEDGLEGGNHCSYRIVLGNNIMPSLDDTHGQYMMFNINTSESGLHDTKTSLGLYRTTCTNSAIRVQNQSRFDHHSPFSPFYDKTARAIQEIGYLTDSYSKIFEGLLLEKLPFPAGDLVDAFKREQLISIKHGEFAEVYAESEPANTQWDLFNILTRSAQDLPTIREREAGESSAMSIFTQPGGVLETLRKAETRKNRKVTNTLLI